MRRMDQLTVVAQSTDPTKTTVEYQHSAVAASLSVVQLGENGLDNMWSLLYFEYFVVGQTTTTTRCAVPKVRSVTGVVPGKRSLTLREARW